MAVTNSIHLLYKQCRNCLQIKPTLITTLTYKRQHKDENAIIHAYTVHP